MGAIPMTMPARLRAASAAFLVGPTAAGKTELALAVAERSGASILSLDSMLVYRGMDVGTAKPDRAARARVPHLLLDLVDPPERYDVSRYAGDAARALEEVVAAGRRPLFVGGTGLYLKTLLSGLFEGPAVDRELRTRIETRAEREGLAVLHAELARIDPAAALRIHPNDRKRIVRGLEVWEQTGRTLSSWQEQWTAESEAEGLPLVGLRVEPDELDRRVRQRTNEMLEQGWVEEATGIRAGCGFGPTSAQALGYAEVLALADGEIDRAEAVERIVLRTRQLARRQRTWFRSFPSLRWIESPSDRGSAPAAVDAILRAIG